MSPRRAMRLDMAPPWAFQTAVMACSRISARVMGVVGAERRQVDLGVGATGFHAASR